VIAVLVVDDHAIVRTGLSQVLQHEPDVEVVGAVGSGEQALDRARQRAPDVVLMDLSMPGMDGIETTRRLLAEHAAAAVVVLTSFADRERIVAALDAGAVGYLLKDAAPAEIVAGVRAAARGEAPLAPKAASVLLHERSQRKPTDGLSEREREVLGLLAGGSSNKEIARRLQISERTVKGHLTAVFRQIGVFDRVQAALWAREHGIGDRR
jgi:DNA-binding NarL/FixJ family response regulator